MTLRSHSLGYTNGCQRYTEGLFAEKGSGCQVMLREESVHMILITLFRKAEPLHPLKVGRG